MENIIIIFAIVCLVILLIYMINSIPAKDNCYKISREITTANPETHKIAKEDVEWMIQAYIDDCNRRSTEYCPIIRDGEGFIPCEDSCPWLKDENQEQYTYGFIFKIKGQSCNHPDYEGLRIGEWKVEGETK